MEKISPVMEQAVRGLTKPQLQDMLESMKAELHPLQTPAAPASRKGLVEEINENGEQKQAREEFQRTLANLKDLSQQHHQPTLRDLAPAIFEGTGKSWEALAPERKLAYPDFVRRNAAGRIERGRIYPADPMVKGLFDLLHEEEAEAIKAIIGQKLDAAGNEQWASSWREYLSPPAVDGAGVADQQLDVAADAGPAGVPTVSWEDELREKVRIDREEGIKEVARANARNILGVMLHSIDRMRAESNPYLSSRQALGHDLAPWVMANNIFRGRILPDEEIYRQVKESFTNQEDRKALIDEIVAKVRELEGGGGSLDSTDQAWLAAWEKEFEPINAEPAANKALPPEIDGDPELTRIYTGILQEEGGAEMGERFLEAIKRLMESDSSLDFRNAALTLIQRGFRNPNG